MLIMMNSIPDISEAVNGHTLYKKYRQLISKHPHYFYIEENYSANPAVKPRTGQAMPVTYLSPACTLLTHYGQVAHDHDNLWHLRVYIIYNLLVYYTVIHASSLNVYLEW